jgi:hypothetical protein
MGFYLKRGKKWQRIEQVVVIKEEKRMMRREMKWKDEDFMKERKNGWKLNIFKNLFDHL